MRAECELPSDDEETEVELQDCDFPSLVRTLYARWRESLLLAPPSCELNSALYELMVVLPAYIGPRMEPELAMKLDRLDQALKENTIRLRQMTHVNHEMSETFESLAKGFAAIKLMNEIAESNGFGTA